MKAYLPQMPLVLLLVVASVFTATTYGAELYHLPFDTVNGTNTPDTVGGNTGILLNGPVQVPGIIGSGALQFDGSDDTVTTTNKITGPNIFTLSLWFKTNTTAGGKLIGFGDVQNDISGSYDRHIYMATDGHIVFGVYPGGVKTVALATPMNDNKWHHVAASLGAGGMALYIDGALVASDATTTSGQAYDGWWKIGRDNVGGWTDQPNSQAFAGLIDEVRIYDSALSAAEVSVLAKRPSATTLVNAPTPSLFGTTVTFSGTVTADMDTPTGTVTLMEGATTIGTGTITNGAYSIDVTTLAAGNHTIFARYSGDNTFLSSDSSSVVQTVNAPTTTTLTVSPNSPAIFGTPVTLTATVTAPSGTPAGTVTFNVDGVLSSVTLNGGTASLTLSTLAVGPHVFSASFAAGTGYLDSASTNVNYTIVKASSTTTIVSSLNPAPVGQGVTFTAFVATVAPSTAQPTGTVTFTVDGVMQAPVALTSGAAALTLTLAAGDHSVFATYSGSGQITGSTSTTLTESLIVPPLAAAQTIYVPINTAKSLTLSGSDPANGLPLTYSVFTQSAHGTLSGAEPNLIYTPAAGFTGTDTFTFRSYNTRVYSLPATVTLIVLPPPSFGSSITLLPNPVFAGQPLTGFSPVEGVTTSWNWGDGSPASFSASASHTFVQTGVYTVSVTVTDPLTGLSTVETVLAFVSASLDSSSGTTPGGAATPPGTLGILVGGGGATAAQGGKGKITCNYIRRDKTVYSGQLGTLAIPAGVTQASLTNVPSTLTIGTGAAAAVFRFDLSSKGKGKATGLPQIAFDVKKKRFLFKAQRTDLTSLTESLGAPQQFTKSSTPITLLVPVTLQLGTQYFVAMTFELKYHQVGKSGTGTLAP